MSEESGRLCKATSMRSPTIKDHGDAIMASFLLHVTACLHLSCHYMSVFLLSMCNAMEYVWLVLLLL
jgi:hypothetical protein